MDDFLTVSNISKKHGDSFLLHDISFAQAQGEKIAIAGETGSGKTTLMKIVGGVGQADSGEVIFEGKPVKGIHDKLMPGHKGIAYLSQYFELQNNYRVSELLAYANDLTDAQSDELYRVCRIEHLLQRWSQTLSGGEKQRVALAKLLTQIPRLLLLDEPFSNLDLIHANQLKDVIKDIGGQLCITCMLISHKPEDILPWANKVLVVKEGRIIQQGSSQDIYNKPISEYVAGLFGKYNILQPAIATKLGKPTEVPAIVRPEHIIISDDKTKGLPAVVADVAYMGSHYEIILHAEGEALIATMDRTCLFKKGQEVYVTLV